MTTVYIASRDSRLRRILIAWFNRRSQSRNETGTVTVYRVSQNFFDHILGKSSGKGPIVRLDLLIIDMRHLSLAEMAEIRELLRIATLPWCIVLASPPDGFVASLASAPALAGTIDDDTPDYSVIDRALEQSARINSL